MTTAVDEIVADNQHWASSPKRATYSQQQELPDSPTYIDKYSTNSDDLQPTSDLHPHSSTSYDYHHRVRHQQNLVIVGSYDKPVTLGRGGACTVKIGRRNRQISRVHVSISFNEQHEQFELTVLGMNGVCVDNIQYEQHAVATLDDNSFVDVLGDQFLFRVPPPSIDLSQRFEELKKEEEMAVDQKTTKDIFDEEPSPKINPKEDASMDIAEPIAVENKETQKQQEDEAYPVELVPEGALTPFEKEASPEQDASIPEVTTTTELVKQEEVKEEEILKEEQKNEETENEEKKDPASDAHDYAEVIIDALVFSRTSSMPISDICSRILKANPMYAEQPREVWVERIRTVLKDKPFFGEIQRKGKTADGSPKENLYYYNSELDPVEWRRATYTQVGRSARKCTLKDKQYFWKIPPKLGRHRNSYIPPPASDQKRQRTTKDTRQGDENIEPKKAKR